MTGGYCSIRHANGTERLGHDLPNPSTNVWIVVLRLKGVGTAGETGALAPRPRNAETAGAKVSSPRNNIPTLTLTFLTSLLAYLGLHPLPYDPTHPPELERRQKLLVN